MTTRPHAFNYQLQRLMIGLVALSLPIIVMIFGCNDLTSISSSYHSESRDIFVACLAAVGLLMIPYQGKSGEATDEYWVSKIGGVAAIVVALVPTSCPEQDEPSFACLVGSACGAANQPVHIMAAVVVFASLFWLCIIFRKRALDKFKSNKYTNARVRKHIYELCMIGILLGTVLVGLDMLGFEVLGATTVFWGEAIMLFSFAIAWMTASQMIIADKQRPSILPVNKN